MTPKIHTSPRDSALLGLLVRLLPTINARLKIAEAWRGLTVRDIDADTAYVRLISRDLLVVGRTNPRRYLIGAHCFDQVPAQSQLHNHRYPLAVFPFAENAAKGTDLYEMPWESHAGGRRVESGRMTVRAGQPYALDQCLALYHAVHSLRPHMSVSLAEVTGDPARAERLAPEGLPQHSTDIHRVRIHDALDHHLQAR